MAGLLDWRIYRELLRSSEDPTWGLYPHPPIDAIAKRLGLARGTVWDRIRSWTRDGFFLGYDLFPHPGLLGVGVEGLGLDVPSASARRAILEELEFIDGVFESMCDVDPVVNVLCVSDSPESRSRRERLLLRLDGVKSLRFRYPIRLPECPGPLKSSDWELVAALRRQPGATMVAIAEEVGRTTRSVARAYERLRKCRAVLAYTVEDFRNFPGTVANLEVRLGPNGERTRVAAELQNLDPESLETPVVTETTGRQPPLLILTVFRPSAASVEQLALDATSVKGVLRVETHFLGWNRSYRHWFDARLFETTKGLARANSVQSN